MNKRLAILDIDGTLFDGNLGIEFVKSLIQKGIFNNEIGNEIFNWYGKYKSGKIEKSVAVDKIYKLYARGLKGKERDKVEELALETWHSLISRLYDFVPELIEFLKKDGFLILLISGSPLEMVSKLSKNLDVDKKYVISGGLEIENGVYTGKIISYLGGAEQKVRAVKDWIKNKKFSIDWSSSMAIGNNERDVGIMNIVGISIAFEANDTLQREAKNNGWILVSRDTLIDTIKEKLKR
ncbi:HAD-IB family phosphatase [Patescibacteria group bacterium]|nr:HAD-IB family phosphatase [Patescibacteria group bacterium]